VWATNVVVTLLVVAACLLVGWQTFLLVELPLVVLAGGAGIWLFYVQHQYEGTYWESSDDWDYTDAALKGSSHLALPRLLQFFSGNIGFHHVHHFDPRIPNYNLQRAHEEHAMFRTVPALTLADGARATRLKLWDEETRRMVTWAEIKP
jgi:omega-6 fatty acid desaturase (delta-12 desaturase)